MAQIERLPHCEDCAYPKGRTAAPRGNVKARLVIVGESPGRKEAIENTVFIGDSWKLLKSVIPNEALEDPNAYYIINAFLCNPTGRKDQSKLTACTRACRERLLQEITAWPRDVILVLGNPALWSLTGNYSLKITQERGTIIPSEYASKGIYVATHPAFLLRGGGNYQQFKKDIEAAFEAVGYTTTPQPKALQQPSRARKPKVAPIEDPTFIEVTLDNIDQHLEVLEALPKEQPIAADLETSGLKRKEDYILCLGVAYKPEETLVFTPEVLRHPRLKAYLESDRLFVWHNGKFDVGFWQEVDVEARVAADTMLMSYSLNEHKGFHDLDQVSQEHLGTKPYKDMLSPYLENKATSYSVIPTEVLYKYLAKDCSATLQLYSVLGEKVFADKNLKKLCEQTLFPASNFLANVEDRGMPIDLDRLKENGEILRAALDNLQAEIDQYVPANMGSINVNSWQQVQALVYNHLGLKVRGKKKTDKDTLEKVLPKHPVIDLIIKYRHDAKQLSTYTTGIENRLYQGCIHSTLLLHGTKTGRLASRNPNVQNIPREKRIRNLFKCRDRRLLLKTDLNQAELRVLAVLSGDRYLLELFRDNTRNLHDEMVEFLFGMGWNEEQRMRAKAVNFGIPYGRKAISLALEFGHKEHETQRWIDDWFDRAPGAKIFIDKCRDAPLQQQNIVTPFGRKRRFGVVSRENVDELQNEASNFPIQGPASDITLHAAMNTDDELESMDVHIINLVHDEILSDVPDLETAIIADEIITTAVQRAAEKWLSTDLPFPTNSGIGTHWGNLKDLEDPELKTFLAAHQLKETAA